MTRAAGWLVAVMLAVAAWLGWAEAGHHAHRASAWQQRADDAVLAADSARLANARVTEQLGVLEAELATAAAERDRLQARAATAERRLADALSRIPAGPVPDACTPWSDALVACQDARAIAVQSADAWREAAALEAQRFALADDGRRVALAALDSARAVLVVPPPRPSRWSCVAGVGAVAGLQAGVGLGLVCGVRVSK